MLINIIDLLNYIKQISSTELLKNNFILCCKFKTIIFHKFKNISKKFMKLSFYQKVILFSLNKSYKYMLKYQI